MTDDEIREMATINIEDFITWRAFAGKPEYGWLDAVQFETDAYSDFLTSSEPEPEGLFELHEELDEYALQETFLSR